MLGTTIQSSGSILIITGLQLSSAEPPVYPCSLRPHRDPLFVTEVRPPLMTKVFRYLYVYVYIHNTSIYMYMLYIYT